MKGLIAGVIAGTALAAGVRPVVPRGLSDPEGRRVTNSGQSRRLAPGYPLGEINRVL